MESKKGINLFLEVTNLDGDLEELSTIAEQIKNIIYKNYTCNSKYKEDIIVKRSEIYVDK